MRIVSETSGTTLNTPVFTLRGPRGRRERGPEKTFEEIITENFPNMAKKIVSQVQEALCPKQDEPKKEHTWDIVIKLTKVKDKNKKQLGRMTNNMQRTSYQAVGWFLNRNYMEWHDILKVMKGKNLQPKILYPARLSFRFDGEIKSFADKQKLKEFSTAKPALQQLPRELL